MPTKADKSGAIPETTSLKMPRSPMQPPPMAAPERAPEPQPTHEGRAVLPDIPLPSMLWKIYERMKRLVWLTEGGGSGSQAHRETTEINLAAGETRTINFAIREIPRYWHIVVDASDGGPLRVSEGGSVIARMLGQDTRESLSVWPGSWKRMPARDKQITLLNQGTSLLHVTIHAVGRGEILEGVSFGRDTSSQTLAATKFVPFDVVIGGLGFSAIWTPPPGRLIRWMGISIAAVGVAVPTPFQVGASGTIFYSGICPVGQNCQTVEFRSGIVDFTPGNPLVVVAGIGINFVGTAWGIEV